MNRYMISTDSIFFKCLLSSCQIAFSHCSFDCNMNYRSYSWIYLKLDTCFLEDVAVIQKVLKIVTPSLQRSPQQQISLFISSLIYHRHKSQTSEISIIFSYRSMDCDMFFSVCLVFPIPLTPSNHCHLAD